jgi:hypothetical protein
VELPSLLVGEFTLGRHFASSDALPEQAVVGTARREGRAAVSTGRGSVRFREVQAPLQVRAVMALQAMPGEKRGDGAVEVRGGIVGRLIRDGERRQECQHCDEGAHDVIRKTRSHPLTRSARPR